jgi:hypothetical protein
MRTCCGQAVRRNERLFIHLIDIVSIIPVVHFFLLLLGCAIFAAALVTMIVVGQVVHNHQMFPGVLGLLIGVDTESVRPDNYKSTRKKQQ